MREAVFVTEADVALCQLVTSVTVKTVPVIFSVVDARCRQTAVRGNEQARILHHCGIVLGLGWGYTPGKRYSC